MKNIFKKAKKVNLKNIFKKKERGAVNLVEIIVIIGIGLLLALVFRNYLSGILKTITDGFTTKINGIFAA